MYLDFSMILMISLSFFVSFLVIHVYIYVYVYMSEFNVRWFYMGRGPLSASTWQWIIRE